MPTLAHLNTDEHNQGLCYYLFMGKLDMMKVL